ncbi:DUF4913 domain-containing protein [Salinactinospora qingdaonensis]|uniref:DUF4913 domain-containing protein n=1 Tax=Salinactinospora qingdaonensis TaxID=702744 RepID=A0ABP7GDC9_9ACTN
MTSTDDRIAPTEAGLTDRVTLLQNAMHRLGADVIRLQTQLTELAGDNHPQATESQGAPPFIFNMTPDAYRAELSALITWVNEFLLPVYLGASAVWCPVWWQHHEAVGRLHALRLSYTELTDTATAGPSGPGVWHRDHLDPTLARLTSPDGPFAECHARSGHVERSRAARG